MSPQAAKTWGIILIVIAVVILLIAFLSAFGIISSWLVVTLGVIATFVLSFVLAFWGINLVAGKDPMKEGKTYIEEAGRKWDLLTTSNPPKKS